MIDKEILYDHTKSLLKDFAWFLAQIILFIMALEIVWKYANPLVSTLQELSQVKLVTTFIITLTVPKSKTFKTFTLLLLFWMNK